MSHTAFTVLMSIDAVVLIAGVIMLVTSAARRVKENSKEVSK